MSAPIYQARPIHSIKALSRALECTPGTLQNLAKRASSLYIGPMRKLKKDGKTFRDVYDTKPPLKPLLQKINRRIFTNVDFPLYLQGSLRGRDFVSNTEIHENSKIVISEDIEKYFDNISDNAVFSIWKDFFKFGHEPAEILTLLTTREGRVFQGTPTSSYLANLAFWDIEGVVMEKLLANDLRYSRYVDDVTISSTTSITQEQKTWAISQIIAMVGSRGFRTARSKHKIQSGNQRISIMKLNANQKIGLSSQERSRIRAAVFQLQEKFNCEGGSAEFQKALNQASGRISLLSRFHPTEARQLREQLHFMKSSLDPV